MPNHHGRDRYRSKVRGSAFTPLLWDEDSTTAQKGHRKATMAKGHVKEKTYEGSRHSRPQFRGDPIRTGCRRERGLLGLAATRGASGAEGAGGAGKTSWNHSERADRTSEGCALPLTADRAKLERRRLCHSSSLTTEGRRSRMAAKKVPYGGREEKGTALPCHTLALTGVAYGLNS
ncbi:uncharacterized protein LOC120349309 [Nilaparvata lugens]|uniref:uncharacterized protein LOC120349309 n=1 Tax=Nilaparvata lugens TaxID=108931 RepID=UPI00193C9B31|nr:uncharacterized protein LOC120349309 [Nilaparvata lugens]